MDVDCLLFTAALVESAKSAKVNGNCHLTDGNSVNVASCSIALVFYRYNVKCIFCFLDN